MAVIGVGSGFPKGAERATVAPEPEGGSVSAATKIDPRSERVRARLLAAATELGAHGESFSVSALARRAGVSRSVFYVHFDDLADFALHLQQVHIGEIAHAAALERDADPHDAMLRSQRALVAHFGANRSLYRAAFSLAGGGAAGEGTVAALSTAIMIHISEVGTMPAGMRADIAARYIAEAVTGVLASWLAGELEASEEELAQHLYALLPSWMHDAPPSAAGTTGGQRRKGTP
ncbi:TetR/AcrR family transcriptional regulator [Leucobacter sp. NPDC015123]|uniref:TetR/AcrR family transcriptional regulator n=1 Tax=Leucobacter sp. NPDC015123 TaxID=3364129 RepID=UPI0036F46434